MAWYKQIVGEVRKTLILSRCCVYIFAGVPYCYPASRPQKKKLLKRLELEKWQRHVGDTGSPECQSEWHMSVSLTHRRLRVHYSCAADASRTAHAWKRAGYYDIPFCAVCCNTNICVFNTWISKRHVSTANTASADSGSCVSHQRRNGLFQAFQIWH